jgi:hypothetical protein
VVLSAEALLDRYGPEILAGKEIQVCLIVCGAGLRELKSALDGRQIPAPLMGKVFAGCLFHSFDQSTESLRALEGFFNGAKIAGLKFSSGFSRYGVSDQHPEMCGALSGLSFCSTERALGCGVQFELLEGAAETIISIDEASLLTRVRHQFGEVFIASSTEILDLEELTSKNIDFRACFSKVVPILLALRHLFRGSCWAPEVHYANIVIDDPSLWPRYGHLDLEELAAFVDRTGCACTIAMIPWNFRRSNRRVVSLLASRQPRLGLCVHGCNHTGAEFGSHDMARLNGMLAVARRRMDAHQRSTALPYQQVMVFPQGNFSTEAMNCLRTGCFLAAVNTEVADCWRQARVTFQDVLNPAVQRYDQFPLFIRRKPEDGVVNYAVDSFLGKPCLVVLHHDFFKGGMKNLEELVRAFAAFQPLLTWDSLENIVKGCSLSRRDADGRKIVQIFADRANISASKGRGEGLTVVKKKAYDYEISRVEVDDRKVDFSFENGFLKFNLEFPSAQTVSLSIVPAESGVHLVTEDSFAEKVRIAMRRYACDFRDNYLATKSETLLRYAYFVIRAIRKR